MFDESEASCRGSVSSAEGSPVTATAPLARGLDSKTRAPPSGTSSAGSPKRSRRRTSSSRTSPPVHAVGCPTCGATCTCWGTVPVPTRFLPPTSVLLTCAAGSSSLLPTPSASSYGSNQGGAKGRTGKVRLSLESMARKGRWPTPTARDWKSGASNKHGVNARPLNEVVYLLTPGPLNPTWVEWLMGFPIEHTVCVPSGTPSCLSAAR